MDDSGDVRERPLLPHGVPRELLICEIPKRIIRPRAPIGRRKQLPQRNRPPLLFGQRIQLGPRPRPPLRRPLIRILGNLIPYGRRMVLPHLGPRVLFVRRLELGEQAAPRVVLACERVLVFCPDEGDDVGKGGVGGDHPGVAVGADHGVPEFGEDLELCAEPDGFAGVGGRVAIGEGEVPPEGGSSDVFGWGRRNRAYQLPRTTRVAVLEHGLVSISTRSSTLVN